jgi:hypothetical protein
MRFGETIKGNQELRKVLRNIEKEDLLNVAACPHYLYLYSGIDTQKSRPNLRAQKQSDESGLKDHPSNAKTGAAFVKIPIKPGDPVTLEFDVWYRDRYGNSLGYQ